MDLFNYSTFLALTLFLFFDLLIEVTESDSNFDPFMDSNLFSIKWQGQLDLTKEELHRSSQRDKIDRLGDRHLMITTHSHEHYRCILPESLNLDQGRSSDNVKLTVDEVMKPLFKQNHCSYRIESYWTYELCHGKHLRQYHEIKEPGSQPRIQEYFLGLGNHRELMTEESRLAEQSKIPVREIEKIRLPYYEVIMGHGTKCDLTGQPRKAHILYVCHLEGRGEVFEFKESSTCVYEVIVLSALLCKHPSYKPKTKPVSEIRCHAMFGSPLKPSELSSIEYETRHMQMAGQDYITEEIVEKRQPQFHRRDPEDKEKADQKQDPQSQLGTLTDKQTLRDILSGSQCLRGGTGWWKYEICFGKLVKQFHMEVGKENNIFLGYWNKEKHLAWLQANPNKRPKPVDVRKHVSLYYSDGDICDLSKKPRNCEVRLKCLQNFNIPHAVVLSLAEPESCQYVLTVESALFCEILKDADENALFEHLDL